MGCSRLHCLIHPNGGVGKTGGGDPCPVGDQDPRGAHVRGSADRHRATQHLVTHGVTADCAILAEPTDLRIASANMGCMWLRLTLGGSVAHAANSSKPGVFNAITRIT